MTLSLFIHEEFIESVEVDTDKIVLVEQRERMVLEYACWLRTRYRRDLMIARDWEIVLTVKSKMNEKATID